MSKAAHVAPEARHTLRVRGQVQGVGFRPFIYRLARDLDLTGTVRNDPGGVTIEVQGPISALDLFRARIPSEAPALARVDDVSRVGEGPPLPDETAFTIIASEHGPAPRGRVTVDAATCAACLREMRDPSDRRHGHALVNCTECGPRYTIILDLPYDRPATTMAPFAMCPSCAAEYGDPGDRRFHAQPVCCPACGPRVRLLGTAKVVSDGEAVRQAITLLREGRIVAIKGLGGYHLAVDAGHDEAVARLRQKKRRDHKPFALLAADLEVARTLIRPSAEAEARLLSAERPIVIAPRREGAPVALSVAPGSHLLGVMLPYTPLQHLLFDGGAGPLVMTSANHANDPLLEDDDEITSRLADLHDAVLVHDRGIARAVDDSVLRDGPRAPVVLRRARGYVPVPLPLPQAATRPGLCMGGELKSAVAVVSGGEVVLSQHLGDLDYALGWTRFLATCDDLLRLFDVVPTWVACDAHPGYRSTRHAQALARKAGLDCFEVQHHHAHLAAVMAEHGRAAPTIGLVCDGVGYGGDGEAWGGEVLVGDLMRYERVGRLRPLRLPGGDAAARETGRCALSWMWDLLGDNARHDPRAARVLPDEARREGVADLLAHDRRCPPSSGVGRLFDATAALLGVCLYNHHEAMSGLELEAQASRASARPAGDGVITLAPPTREGTPFELDTRPLLAALLDDVAAGRPASEAAWFFHDALADGLARAAVAAAEQTGIRTVALSGGVFCNMLLLERLIPRLEHAGHEVLTHAAVPPNDGGLAYGQAAVAAARLACGARA